MASMNVELREIFRTAYFYRQLYQHPTDEREFWKAAARDKASAVRGLGDHPFARALFDACYADIERELLATERPEQMKIL